MKFVAERKNKMNCGMYKVMDIWMCMEDCCCRKFHRRFSLYDCRYVKV